MAVVNNYENVVARSSSGEIRNSPTYKRTFTVRCDNPDTSMVDIANAPGISYGDPHPHDASCFVTNVDVDADGDSMLIYTVSYSYTRPVGDLSVTGGTPTDPNSGGGSPNPNTPPDPLKIPDGYWSGGSNLETRQSPVTTTGKTIRMTNGRPFTSGLPTDFASEQIVMTNFYESYDDVSKIGESVDKMNKSLWPVGSEVKVYGPLAWKIVSFNWSFKQQTSEQQRLEYYEVSVTLQRSTLELFNENTMQILGWPDDWTAPNGNGPDGKPTLKPVNNRIPSHFPKIVSAGFREKYYKDPEIGVIPVFVGLRDITTDVVYYGCDGSPIDPDKIPTDPGQDPDGPCDQFPRKEPTTEEMPLDLIGRQVPPDTEGVMVIPWMEDIEPVDFVDLFGNGPPYAPKKGPL
ncbi:MAG: hypothetical protein ACR2NF_02575 [Pirellulales bacterium]